MFAPRAIQPFEKLHWRLMLAYVLVTSVATLCVGLIVMACLTADFYLMHHRSNLWVERARDAVAGVAMPLANVGRSPQNRADILAWIDNERTLTRNLAPEQTNGMPGTTQFTLSWYLNPSPHNIGVAAVDRNGIVVASRSIIGVVAGQPLLAAIRPSERHIVTSAMRDDRLDDHLGMTASTGTVSVAVPANGPDGKMAGIVFMRVRTLPSLSDWLVGLASLVLCFTIAATCLAVIFGAVYSYFTSRWITERLDVISAAVVSWSAGDFSPRASETPRDELGDLGRRLNSMVNGLGELFDLRQSLAALHERDRLARDLHDTVKQQAFAAAMQIGAARASLEANPQAAQTAVVEAAAIVQRMQRDLAVILKELGSQAPHAEVVDLKTELIQHAQDWSRQNQIRVDAEIVPRFNPPEPVRTAIIAIVDEALSNVLRHSKATSVCLRLHSTPNEGLELNISDDGVGFNGSRPASRGMGLKNMRGRAESLPHGSFTLEANAGAGVCITVRCTTSAENAKANAMAVGGRA